MPMIDVYAAAGTFGDPKKLAQQLAATLMTIEQVPDIPMFRKNTAAFVHELPALAISNVDDDSDYALRPTMNSWRPRERSWLGSAGADVVRRARHLGKVADEMGDERGLNRPRQKDYPVDDRRDDLVEHLVHIDVAGILCGDRKSVV